MAKYFEINGYFKDDRSPINGSIVSSDDYDEVRDANIDEFIFFYGLPEEELKRAVELGEEFEEEFVITGYAETIIT